MFGRLALVLLVPILVALGATTLLRASAAAPLEGAARSARRRSVAATVTTGLAGLAALVRVARERLGRGPADGHPACCGGSGRRAHLCGGGADLAASER